jgi:rRNA-processing protein FCF1
MPVLLCDTDFLIKITNEPVPELTPFLESSGFDLATLPAVEKELKGLLQSEKRSTARKAKLALESLNNKVTVESGRAMSGSDADVHLVNFQEKSKEEIVIATLDGSLLSKLERKRVPYLTLRHDRPFYRQFSRATYLTTKNE